MRPQDPQRFAEFVAAFIARCGIAPPFHVVAIGSNGAVRVSHHSDGGVEKVCATPGDLVAPLTVTVIAPDGRGRSAVIEIKAGIGSLRLM